MRRNLLLLLVLCAAPLLAQNECQKLTHEALEAYGGLESLKNYPTQLQAQLNAQAGHDTSMSESEKARFTETVMKNISAERLIKHVETSISTNCDVQQMRAVLADIKSPLVQKMRGLESLPNTPEGAEKLRAYLASPEAKNYPEKRKQLINQMVAIADSTEALVDTIIETSRGMLEGMGAPAATPEQIAEMRKRVTAQADQQMKDTMLAIYRTASDEDLEAYIAMQKRPEFHAYNVAFMKAVASGMGMEARTTGTALKALLDQISAERKKAEEQKAAPAATPAAPSPTPPK
jgi:hypothetical protein